MIKEYQFAALIYNEETGQIGCAACGREVRPSKCLYKTAGRWVCGKCLRGFETDPVSECALCSTVKAAIER